MDSDIGFIFYLLLFLAFSIEAYLAYISFATESGLHDLTFLKIKFSWLRGIFL